MTHRTQPGAPMFTNRHAARWFVLLERAYGPPQTEGADRVWTNVPEFFEVRLTVDDKKPITATRQTLFSRIMWKMLGTAWPVTRTPLGLTSVHAESLDAAAVTFAYLEQCNRDGSKPQQSRLRRQIEGRILPAWYRRVA